MRTRADVLGVSVLAVFSLTPARLSAQDCACDHELALSVTTADGAALGIEPGDVVCLAPGDRPFLRIQGFVGTEAEPITVTSCGGVATISNPDRAYALVIEGQSRFLRVTGTNVDGVEHGIRVSAPATEPYAGVGVWIQGRSSDVEVDHIEISDTGFAGVMAKTDPGCDDRAGWDDYVQRNVHLHHLWVHDVGGEGFYIGSTQAAGYTRTCDGASVTIPAHFLDGIEIDHVLVEDSGWDGMQVGFARSGCSVHDNVLRRVGLEGVMYQQQGLQIGAYSACDVRRNVISDGPALGIIVLDSGDSTFADNVIARTAGGGIYANLRDLVDAASWRFVHNTIVEPGGGSAIRVLGTGVTGVAWNNFVIGAADGSIASGSAASIEIADNVFETGVEEAGVVGADDFHLTDRSPARGAGRDLRAMGFDRDLDGLARAATPSVGAYEHADDAPDAGPIADAGTRSDAGALDAGTMVSDGAISTDGGSEPGPSSGCACRAGDPRSRKGATVAVLGVLGAVLARRRCRA